VTITLFGQFGTQNLGNECTLEAMLANIRTYLPDARVECVCTHPADTAARHGIQARAMSYRDGARHAAPRWPFTNPIVRFLRRLLFRVPREVIDCLRAFRALAGTTIFLVPGTGILGDFGTGVLGLHYELAKWTFIARRRGIRIMFVSVGGGRLRHPLSRWFVKSALASAHYRSYRDSASKHYLDTIGFDTSCDLVYPDLAFSLPLPALGCTNGSRLRREVGVGVMLYYGINQGPEEGERLYRIYCDRLAAFVAWLLEHQYTVRLLIGDVAYDPRNRRDLIATLRERLEFDEAQLISEPIASVDDLHAQLAKTDLVVATRFHNILLALTHGKPVLALSYETKNDALMASMGLAQYCHSVERFDVDRLVQQFVDLDAKADGLKSHIERKVAECRTALSTQYLSILGRSRTEPSAGLRSPARNGVERHRIASTSTSGR
jgi:polysaccharide pyruvyl transferase WcaK-like protein